jgi:hypothetical protein
MAGSVPASTAPRPAHSPLRGSREPRERRARRRVNGSHGEPERSPSVPEWLVGAGFAEVLDGELRPTELGLEVAGCTSIGSVDEHDDLMPEDPDVDDLPEELWRHPRPFTISAVDPDTGETYSAQLTREQIAAGFADARRRREDDETA